MSFKATKRPSEDVFIAAISELGQVTTLLADRFGASRDAVRKWYEHYGIDAPYKYKLEADDIPLIRELQDCFSSGVVADKFEVSPRTIRDVWNRVTWGWV